MLCPKCHHPLEEDGEAYICCAGATLQWRCTSCAKVSEGFAFPYGLCPLCGGKLETIATKPVEGEAALAGIRSAFEIELGGQAFYRNAAKQSTDPVLKDLFGRFAKMEEEHMLTLSRRYHVAAPSASAGFTMDQAAVYAGVENHPSDPANLFNLAIAFEERAVAFFVGQEGKVKAGTPEQLLYKELAAEEREHVALLKTELHRWKAGKPGLL